MSPAAANNGNEVIDSTTAAAAAVTSSNDASSYVFLQKFPLKNSFNSIFHTEVLVCPKSGFDLDDQKYLDDIVTNIDNFEEIAEDWWTTRTSNCVEFGYGGTIPPCTKRCCGSPYTSQQQNFPLNDRRAVIGNADTSQKSLFLYGISTHVTSDEARDELCPPTDTHQPCWSNWAGIDYNPLTNNCNTYTSALLHCIFGLSEEKPNLGPSDLIKVTCDKCPTNDSLSALYGDGIPRIQKAIHQWLRG